MSALIPPIPAARMGAAPLRRWLAVSLLAGTCGIAQVHAADLTVQVEGARSATGMVLVALYDAADAFLQPGRHAGARMMPAKVSGTTVVFKDLPPGRYALTAFHDENANTKLDRNLVGTPTEAVGFSNNVMGSGAAPSFEQAAVVLKADTAITIRIH